MTLKTFPRQLEVTYGPIPSRRLGLSLGINILPKTRKICSYDCPYCQLGRTKKRTGDGYPTPAEVEKAVRDDLAWLRRVGLKPDALTFSGNGEPTLHPKFAQVVGGVRRARTKARWQIPMVVLTNGAHLDRPAVLKALKKVERTIVKLDAGNEAMFRKINRPARGWTLAKLMAAIRKLPSAVIQTMFVRGEIDNSTDSEVGDWIARLNELDPWNVQIYTVDRVPAHSGMKPLSRQTLDRIGQRVRKECGVVPDVYYPDS